MDDVRVGIVGSGFMGRTHAEALSNYVQGARLVAVAGGSRAGKLVADYNLELHDNVESLFGRSDIHAVVITTPQSVHADQAMLAARYNKHVLMEKPLATTIEDCDRIIEGCREAGVNLMTAQSQRFRGGNLKGKEILNEGTIGQIYMAEELQVNTGGLKVLPSWQSEEENIGTLLGYGVHNLDRLRWFLEDEVEWVSSVTTAYKETAPVEASSMLLMKFRKGTVATFWCTFEGASPGLPLSGFRSRLMGDKGWLDVDGFGLTQLGLGDSWETIYEQPKFNFREEPFSPVRMDAYGMQDQEFIDSIREGRTPAVTGEDGRAAVEIALAAHKASHYGRVIHLPMPRPNG